MVRLHCALVAGVIVPAVANATGNGRLLELKVGLVVVDERHQLGMING
jgi:hypothetical protein